jgi:hypothetical protein
VDNPGAQSQKLKIDDKHWNNFNHLIDKWQGWVEEFFKLKKKKLARYALVNLPGNPLLNLPATVEGYGFMDVQTHWLETAQLKQRHSVNKGRTSTDPEFIKFGVKFNLQYDELVNKLPPTLCGGNRSTSPKPWSSIYETVHFWKQRCGEAKVTDQWAAENLKYSNWTLDNLLSLRNERKKTYRDVFRNYLSELGEFAMDAICRTHMINYMDARGPNPNQYSMTAQIFKNMGENLMKITEKRLQDAIEIFKINFRMDINQSMETDQASGEPSTQSIPIDKHDGKIGSKFGQIYFDINNLNKKAHERTGDRAMLEDQSKFLRRCVALSMVLGNLEHNPARNPGAVSSVSTALSTIDSDSSGTPLSTIGSDSSGTPTKPRDLVDKLLSTIDSALIIIDDSIPNPENLENILTKAFYRFRRIAETIQPINSLGGTGPGPAKDLPERLYNMSKKLKTILLNKENIGKHSNLDLGVELQWLISLPLICIEKRTDEYIEWESVTPVKKPGRRRRIAGSIRNAGEFMFDKLNNRAEE